MMFKKISTVALVSSVFLATGCATILNDQKQNVNVGTSNGAKITGTVDGVPFEAPGIVALQRANSDKVIMVKDPQCASKTVANKSVDPVFFVNILSGGAFGSTTDYSTEKMWKYEDSITINCK